MSSTASNEDARKWNNIKNSSDLPPCASQSQQHPEIFSSNSSNNTSRYNSSNLGQISENYSVLPVGQDYFLKVYHNSETEQPSFNSYELFSSNSILPPHNARMETEKHGLQNGTTNMIINQLVTNWSPNFSGTYSPFGEQNPSMAQHQQQQKTEDQQFLLNKSNQISQNLQNIGNSNLYFDVNDVMISNATNLNPMQSKSINLKSSKTNGSFENQNNLPEMKKRIVAEVKPMRMSYSDVLSKNVEINKLNSNNQGNNSGLNANGDYGPSQTRNLSKLAYDKLKSSCPYSSVERKQNTYDEKDKFDIKNKKSEANVNFSQKLEEGSSINGQSKEKKKPNLNSDEKDAGKGSLNSKKTISGNEKSKSKNQTGIRENLKKRTNRKSDNVDEDDESRSKNNYKEYFYNVTIKTSEGNVEKPQKYFQNSSTKKSRGGQKNSNSSVSNSNGVTSNSFRSEKNTYSKRNQKQRRDIKKEMIIKFIEKWFEYTIKILTWLFYLVYDVVVLSFGIAYDRMKIGYQNSLTYLINLKKDLRQNSGKPSEWIKDLLTKFDSKFSKNSKLAFWRKFNKKKTEESHTEFYKNGRLPQTGDEAMYSLLNCKGKDAYSILGVVPSSSQEQIRKHYKKIAVLVHPDKNKQPGAEEAFKVLQRAFELIGEPENRKSYDQSLAEALHAEKAWSELHDLLSQLQSKIAEAANTIRCSSCGLRHPRKLTDRPHYAARECSSCKIRHSAREGDIWAETSVFGLRWKYLALMDGKCYDITEWANCQKGALSHLKPNSHVVQYRIVRGGQQQQQQQQNVNFEREKMKREQQSEPSLDDFLDNLYSGQNPQNQQQQQQQSSSRRRSRRN
ncbi:putative uncharacterized protein DDB_G0282133 [Condylostylus longicornis]|uniref:putative uncharacterized protein DDB_G0282133 n=1 Tax=Condylostylus longicornis TaxID=2530218 RepID=UPI00244E00E7|nr:putative uncharacterized protein DDB_G0282133 [Condylostylus longicornis]